MSEEKSYKKELDDAAEENYEHREWPVTFKTAFTQGANWANDRAQRAFLETRWMPIEEHEKVKKDHAKELETCAETLVSNDIMIEKLRKALWNYSAEATQKQARGADEALAELNEWRKNNEI